MSVAAPDRSRRRGRRSRFVAILVYTLQSCFPRKRWVARAVPCAGALLFGLLAHAVDETAQRGVRRTSPPTASSGSCCRSPRSSSATPCSAPRCAAGTFHFTWLSPTPTWQIVLGRWLGGVARRARHDRARRAALAAVVAGTPESAGAGVPRRRGRQRGVRRGLHRHRLPHPAHRGVVARVRVPRRAAARRGAHRHRPALADVGVARDLRRPTSTTSRAASSATGSRRAAPRSSGSRS